MNSKNADFTKTVVIDSQQMQWQSSPMPGVERKPLDRVGDEIARATSIVRYAPNSHFSPHVHTGGEEFLVLEGVFQDEHGDYPAGTYVRNPPQSRHTPGSEQGCVIFVKLWQFEPEDRFHCSIDTQKALRNKSNLDGEVNEHQIFQDKYETVSIIEIKGRQKFEIQPAKGAELLMLEGELQLENETLSKYCWMRSPASNLIKLTATDKGARFWLKTGHLVRVEQQIERVTGEIVT